MGTIGVLLASLALSAPQLCKEIGEQVDREAKAAPPASLALLAPYFSEETVPILLKRAQAEPSMASIHLYLTLGLARHAEALRQLRQVDAPGPKYQRIGWALGHLALGDAAYSSTVSEALVNSGVPLRRLMAEALAMMEQKRPMNLLYAALKDDDASVRLTAAKIHVHRYSSRARKVLLSLLRDGDEASRLAATEALLSAHYRFGKGRWNQLPVRLRSQAVVASALRRKRLPGHYQLLLHKDDSVRAGAYAAAALNQAFSAVQLKRVSKKAIRYHPDKAPAELAMSLLLMGEPIEDTGLNIVPHKNVPASLEVLWAYGQGGRGRAGLSKFQARSLSVQLNQWLQEEALDQHLEGQALKALAEINPGEGVRLAQSRVTKASGKLLDTIVEILAREALPEDIDPLVQQLSVQKGLTRARILAAAAKVCQR